MHVETTAGHLKSAARVLGRIVPNFASIPVLRCVRLADGAVTGTDLDMEVSVRLPTAGRMEGAALVDFRGLAALAGHLPADETVRLDVAAGTWARLSFGGGCYRLASGDPDDFPSFMARGWTEGHTTAVHNCGLAAALRDIAFAISSEEIRYYLNGVSFAMEGETMLAVATDGARMAMKPLPFVIAGAAGKILPRRAVGLMNRLGAEPNGMAFDAAGTVARLDYDGLTLHTKLIDATYPDIFRVVPKDAAPLFSAERGALLAALRRLGAVAGRGAGCAVEPDGSQLLVSIVDEEGRRNEERLEAAIGQPFRIGWNIRYLVEALGALRHCETVHFAAGEQPEISPALITGDGSDLRVVLMPRKLLKKKASRTAEKTVGAGA